MSGKMPMDIRKSATNVWRFKTESDRLEAALSAEPESLDILLRLGRARMIEGNFLRAAAVWDRIIVLHPCLAEAHVERAVALRNIDPGESARSTAQAACLGAPSISTDELIDIVEAGEITATLWIDLTDLMDYLKVNTTFSGIQRVVANLIRTASLSPRLRPLVQLVIPDFVNRRLLAVDMDPVVELVDAVEIHHASREHLDRLHAKISSLLRLVEPAPGDIFLMAGAFWISHNYDLLKSLRNSGVGVGLFIHDLIQINNIDYVQPEATDVFRRSLVDVLEVASFVTTNSEFVAREVERFLRDDLNLDCPVRAVPLATEMTVPKSDPLDDAILVEEFGAEGYALCVCTIEIRKNHYYLTDIWEQLLARGRTDVPKLVLVGKWGWQIEPFRRHLAKTNNLNGMVHVKSAVSDRLLASLYRNALFTLYPSFAEGWGLPVGESLVFGKPCIASGVTSIPEVGGPLVRYIDPLDLETGVAQVSRLLDDPSDLAAWRHRIETEFKPRSWSEFSMNLVDTSLQLDRIARTRSRSAFARLAPGEMAVVGGDDVVGAAGLGLTMRSARMARGRGWHHLEFDGVWMKDRHGEISFTALECTPGDLVHVTVELAGTNRPLKCALHTSIEMTSFVPVPNVKPVHIACDAHVDDDSTIRVSLLADGIPVRFADRDNYLRLVRVGFRRAGNREDKVKLMEATLLTA